MSQRPSTIIPSPAAACSSPAAWGSPTTTWTPVLHMTGRVGGTAGVGYDIRVGRNVSLTPVANFVYGGVGDLNVSGGGAPFATGWKQNVVDFGLGVTFH